MAMLNNQMVTSQQDTSGYDDPHIFCRSWQITNLSMQIFIDESATAMDQWIHHG